MLRRAMGNWGLLTFLFGLLTWLLFSDTTEAFWGSFDSSLFCTPNETARCGFWLWLHSWQEAWAALAAAALAVGAALLTIREMQRSGRDQRLRDDSQKQTARYFNVAAHAAAVHHFETNLKDWFADAEIVLLAFAYGGGVTEVQLNEYLSDFPKFPQHLDPSTGTANFLGYTRKTADVLHKVFRLHVKLSKRFNRKASTHAAYDWFVREKAIYLRLMSRLKKKLLELEQLHKQRAHKLLRTLNSDYITGDQLDELMSIESSGKRNSG